MAPRLFCRWRNSLGGVAAAASLAGAMAGTVFDPLNLGFSAEEVRGGYFVGATGSGV